MNIKKKLEKGVWRSKSYYALAREGSLDIKHPGMLILKEAANKSKKILDLGCGEGTRLKLLASGKNGVGVDISDTAIREARKKFPKLKFEKVDLEKIPFTSKSFDLIYSTYVLEHLSDPERVLAEAIRVLTDDGSLVLIAPNYGAPNRASPPFKGSRFVKLLKGVLRDYYKYSGLKWEKVTPIANKDSYHSDWDTAIEPYLGSLIRFLNQRGLQIKIATSCWSQELPNAKLHQKVFRFLGERGLYPFWMWGPHLVVLARK